MIRSVTTTEDAPPAPSPVWFAFVEALLIGAIPLLGVIGFDALLSSRTGTFVEQPGPGEPGWAVLVGPSPVTAVVLELDGQAAGAAIVAQPGVGEDGGAIVVVAPNVLLDGAPLHSLPVDEVALRLGAELDLGVGATVVMDAEAWDAVLGSSTVEVDNPDPIPVAAGESELAIGRIDLGSDDVARFVGRAAAEGPTEAIVVRNERLWEALLDVAGDGGLAVDHPLGALLEQLEAGPVEVTVAPTEAGALGLVFAAEPTEALVRRIVPFPSGADGGDRPAVQILARTASVDLEAIAEDVAALGVEVVLIGYADPFDQGETELVVPDGTDPARFAELVDWLGGDSVMRVADADASPDLVTLRVTDAVGS